MVCALGVLVVGLAACGPPPPQAPLHYAKKLDEATGSISTVCGEADQITAFQSSAPKEWATLEATGISAAQKLALVYHRRRDWLYQGETVSQIVHDSLTMLAGCGLNKVRDALKKATSG